VHDRGHVVPGGPWLDRTDGPLLLRKLSVSSMDNNVYILADRERGEAVLVDVADDAPQLLAAAHGFELLAAIQTHGHWDHVRAWGQLAAAGCEIWGHPDDGPLFPRAIDRALHGGDVLTVGQLEVEVLHVPGHTPGSLCFLVDGATRSYLLSGDTLFPGGHGRTETDADHQRIMDGLEEQVFARLPDDALVLPGHGDDTTIGRERPYLAEWRARGW
jgi:glyoxylase-like metal-dependent hydrolase (beta-lactamase superfamily II)